ncbi:MAG: DNA polymerase IV [candidate division KSB1 bacterium]|nr:DNA polymerase IV [candidate division KSB1 bacterium]
MERSILYVDITAFAVSVETVLEPRLRGRPVVVAVQTANRSLIYASSYEARRAGIHRGMPLQEARRLCRELIVLPPNKPLYARATQAMLDILSRFSPVIEPVRYGHAYLDMTGTQRLFGSPIDAAAKAQREIRDRLNLEATVGVATNKLVSKIASDIVKPTGLQSVRPGYEERFLSPLPVHYLPGVGKTTLQQLAELNVRYIRQLAQIPVTDLTHLLGRRGILLHQWAHGIDPRPVQPPRRQPSIVEEEILPEDTNAIPLLRALLFRLLERACRRLRQEHWMAHRLHLWLRYSDGVENRGEMPLAFPSQYEHEIYPVAEEALVHLLTRRVRVRSLHLELKELRPEMRQLTLFQSEAGERREKLVRALDRIRDRFGERAIDYAHTLVLQ